MVAVGRAHAPAAFLPAKETLFFHESGDAIATVATAGLAQLRAHARAAVGVAAGLANGFNLIAQRAVFLRARPRLKLSLLPIVIAALGNAQDLAQPRDGVFVLHRVDPFVSPGWG
jgi:hypothetical protein